MKRLILLFASILLLSCSDFQRLQKSENPTEKLEGAIAYYEKKDFYRAGLLLDEVLPLVRGTDLAEKASYYIAWCHYQQDEFVLSTYYFKDFYLTFPRSQYTEEATFMHGKSLYRDSPYYNLDQTNSEEALKYLQEYVNKYPEGKFIDETNKLVDELLGKIRKKTYENSILYWKTGNYKAAVSALGSFLNTYPDSEYTEEVAYKRLESQYLLAKNSIASKQKQRYYEAIEIYYTFVDKYPKSTFISKAEEIFGNCQEALK
ncbi:MAG: outer membrane protein assembly factor BamD [Cytophagaceae bacterium]|jgi:outer membrane protein assembly factor BamD|nr:outer membrane protein assembly factor BamD [Cytophagaceae bacterium]